jgi:hypothetical protein
VVQILDILQIILLVVGGASVWILATATPLWLLLRFVGKVRISFFCFLGAYVSAFLAALFLVFLADGFHYPNLPTTVLFLVGVLVLVPWIIEKWLPVSFWVAFSISIWPSAVVVAMVCIPSFVTSPIRENVTTAHGDMRSIANALFEYAGRHEFPIPGDGNGNRIAPTKPGDLLASPTDASTEETLLYYAGPSFVPSDLPLTEDFQAVPTDPFYDGGLGPYAYGVGPLSATHGAFILSSIGPDGERQGERLEFLLLDKYRGDQDDLAEDAEYWTLLYSPTNGVKSPGEIIRFCP